MYISIISIINIIIIIIIIIIAFSLSLSLSLSQIKHGAVPHQSKEEMIVTGRCRKPLGKRTYKKLRKCGVRHCEVLLASLVMSGAAAAAAYTEDTQDTPEKEEDGEGISVKENGGDCMGDVRECSDVKGNGDDFSDERKEEEEEMRMYDKGDIERKENDDKVMNKNTEEELAVKIKTGIKDCEKDIKDSEKDIIDNEREIKDNEGGIKANERGMKIKRNISSHASWEFR